MIALTIKPELHVSLNYIRLGLCLHLFPSNRRQSKYIDTELTINSNLKFKFYRERELDIYRLGIRFLFLGFEFYIAGLKRVPIK